MINHSMFFVSNLCSNPTLLAVSPCYAGPRSWTFSEGERKAALDAVLDVADVVCMTEEEAEAVTGGQQGAEAQARFILGRPGARTEWCVIKRGAEGAVLASRTATQLYSQQALQVDVRDTGEVQGGMAGGGGVAAARTLAVAASQPAAVQLHCRSVAPIPDPSKCVARMPGLVWMSIWDTCTH